MNLNPISGIVEAVGGIVDSLHTSDKERLDAELELRRLGIEEQKVEAGLLQGQVEVNKVEAAHQSTFVAGWRPAVGWCGVAAMGYQFLLYPLLTWVWALLQACGVVPVELAPPPMLDTEALWVILTGILGLGTARTVEKLRGKSRS